MANEITSLEILQSWGVASARNTSGIPVSPSAGPGGCGDRNTEYQYDVPIGPSVVRWDLTSQERLMQFQAHSDLVTCARKSPDQTLIASSAYSGGVKLWSPQWTCLACTTAPMESQFHLAWSHDSKVFLVIGNGKDSSIVLFSVNREQSDWTLRQSWLLRAKDCSSVASTSDGDSSRQDAAGRVARESEAETSEASGRNYPYENAFFMAEFNPSGDIFAVEEIPYKTTMVHLVSPVGRVVRSMDLMAGIQDKESRKRPVNTLFISSHHNGGYTIGLEGGRIVLIDAELLQIKKTFKVGSGFRAALWDGDTLIVPSDSGKVTWWSEDGVKVLEFESCMQDYIVHMDWSVSGEGLWMCGFSTAGYLAVERNKTGVVCSLSPSLVVHCHELTSVGVGFDPSGKMLGSGDMAGNVWVVEKDKVSPSHKFSVSGSVRCLAWTQGDRMLVGTLNGGIHWWGPGESQPHLLLQLQGSVIHMKFDRQHKLLAVGTSQGMLCVYDIIEGRGVRYDTVVEVTAHPPQLGPQDQRFGQLGKQAEIWSLCWSPDEVKLATCSEDQTLKVWATNSWKCLATLRGHSLAVTSVDWVQCGQLNLLASCSDDRTIRLSCGDSYKLLCIVDTKDIHGWHTLTYLTFYPHKDCSCLLLCTTQNGHLVVWRVQEANDDHTSSQQQPPLAAAARSNTGLLHRLWKGKLHLGSVEGLSWQNVVNGGSVATVGADCIVNHFKLILQQ